MDKQHMNPNKLLIKCTSDVYQPACYNKKSVAWHKSLQWYLGYGSHVNT